jgi:stress-induced morphogen
MHPHSMKKGAPYMISPEALVAHLQEALAAPNHHTHVEAFDKTGAADHYAIYVRSTAFEGLPTMAQHRQVNAALKPLIASGQLHAAELHTVVVPTSPSSETP